MSYSIKDNHTLYLAIVAGAGWLIPGGGYFLVNEKKRAVIVFLAITITFLLGLYVGSIGVIDPVKSKIPYVGQILNTPIVLLIAKQTAGGNYDVYARPQEIGQIYTSISGLLNLLCIVNAVYMAHMKIQNEGSGD